MSKTFLMIATISIALGACSGSEVEDAAQGSPATHTPSPVANAPAVAPATATPTPVTSAPTPPAPPRVAAPATPPEGAAFLPDARKGEKGARAVLLTWARALETGNYELAWAQFRHPPAGRNGYAKWWRRYRTITVAFRDGTVEGAAGSSYYAVPVTLSGETVVGEPYRLTGTVMLRRINDIDGVTAEQLAWHIDTADLQDAPVE